MNVLLVIDYYQPKLGYSDSNIIEELGRMGHKVSVLTSNYYFPFPDFEKSAGKILGKRKLKAGVYKENGITVYREELKFEKFARAFFGNQESYLEKIKPDVIVVNKVASFNSVKLSLLKNKYKYRLICYDSLLPSEFNRGNLFLKKFIYTLFRLFFSDLLNKKIDQFIAVQEDTVKIMREIYGIKGKIKFIPLGTDTKLFRSDNKSKDSLRKKYKVENNFVLVYTGKVINSKGVDLLFSSLNLLFGKYKNISLLIVGDGAKDYINYCLSKVDQKYHKNIIWIGFVENKELYKYYNMADVGVWPLQESTSMNDAAACGIPFIANNTIGTRLRISNDNALLYKKGDVKDLANKIEYLYLNTKRRKKMGENGRKLAVSKLSWTSIAREFIF